MAPELSCTTKRAHKAPERMLKPLSRYHWEMMPGNMFLSSPCEHRGRKNHSVKCGTKITRACLRCVGYNSWRSTRKNFRWPSFWFKTLKTLFNISFVWPSVPMTMFPFWTRLFCYVPEYYISFLLYGSDLALNLSLFVWRQEIFIGDEDQGMDTCVWTNRWLRGRRQVMEPLLLEGTCPTSFVGAISWFPLAWRWRFYFGDLKVNARYSKKNGPRTHFVEQPHSMRRAFSYRTGVIW